MLFKDNFIMLKKVFLILVAVMLFGFVGKAQETGTLKDSRDSKVYLTVKIENQWWFAENLAYKPSSGNYWVYKNEDKYLNSFGYLYDFETAVKVCPTGWHLPTLDDINTFQKTIGDLEKAGKALKSKDVNAWLDKNGKDKFGFAALGAGYRQVNGSFTKVFQETGFWVNTNSLGTGGCFYLSNDGDEYIGSSAPEKAGLSVRCIKD